MAAQRFVKGPMCDFLPDGSYGLESLSFLFFLLLWL